jgi:hypothetical protein
MINSALTRWVNQGLAHGICPLCHVSHKADAEYIWYFFDEYSTEDAALEALRRARGFCADHAEQLRRIEVDGLKSTLGIAGTYEDTLRGLADDLSALGVKKGRLERAPCPGCVNRDGEISANAVHLLDLLTQSERARERFAASLGLCVDHFRLVWDLSRGPAERELILAVARRAAERVALGLGEHVRKQGAEFRHEPKGEEERAWVDALHLTGGWPPERTPGRPAR